MPRTHKGPRLQLRATRGNRAAHWVILDTLATGRHEESTGCGKDDRRGAETKLAEYIAQKHVLKVSIDERDPSEIPVADVLSLYAKDVASEHARPLDTARRINRLLDFFGEDMLSAINGARCRAYAKQCSTPAAARRDLEDLRSAINHHRKEGLCSKIISVVLPKKAPPRDRWLTRQEAARLILGAWRYRDTYADKTYANVRGLNTVRRAGKTWYYAWRNGPRIVAPFGTPEFEVEYKRLVKDKPIDRHPRRHVARFMIVARYMGSRAAVICSASIEETRPTDKPWVDLVNGVFYGRPKDHVDSKKKRQTVRVPLPLLAHLRRWRAAGQLYAVEWCGRPVQRISGAHSAAVAYAGLGRDVTPHTWRHSLATWLMQAGGEPWKVAGFLGMSVETLLNNYGHHHPDHSADVHDAILRSKKKAA